MTARSILRSRLRKTDRIAIIGAGGWLGSTVLELLDDIGPRRVVAVAARPRPHQVGHHTWQLGGWADLDTLDPTVVVGLAGVTPSAARTGGVDALTHVNRALADRMIDIARRPSVRAVMMLSSGAAKTDPGGPYGREKAQLELMTAELVTPTRAAAVARAWSLTGPHVRDRSAYAFSDFIDQALRGSIRVTATQPVFRRYIDAAEYMAVCLGHALDGWSGTIDSGGDLLEIGDVARLIADSVEPPAVVHRSLVSTVPETYASDGASWDQACSRVGLTPMTIGDQVSYCLANAREGDGVSGGG